MMISKVEPLHKKVKETTQSVDDAEHRMANLEKKRKVSPCFILVISKNQKL